MRLVNISKIFGVLASIAFVMVIMILVGLLIMDSAATSADVMDAVMYVGLTVIFLLAAILVTLKRIARAIEGSKKE